jgi:hypothetical protein
MGRSVSVPNGSALVCYRDVSGFDDEWDWEAFVEDIVETCKSTWNSFYDCDEWLDNEDHVLVENGLVQVGVSEYMGLASIWIRPKDDFDYGDPDTTGLAHNFVDKIKPKFEEYFGEFVKLGSFSNGEGVYEKVA